MVFVNVYVNDNLIQLEISIWYQQIYMNSTNAWHLILYVSFNYNFNDVYYIYICSLF